MEIPQTAVAVCEVHARTPAEPVSVLPSETAESARVNVSVTTTTDPTRPRRRFENRATEKGIRGFPYPSTTVPVAASDVDEVNAVTLSRKA